MTLHMPREERRRQIVDAFLKVMERKGFAEMTMDDVALEAKVSKGAIYHHFTSKDNLLVHLIRTHSDDMFGAMEKIRASFPDFRSFLIEGGKFLLTKSIDVFSNSEVMMHCMTFPEHRTKFHAMLVEDHYRVIRRIKELLDDAVARGEIKLDDTEGIASTVNAIFSGLTMHAKVLPLEALTQAWVAFAELLLSTSKPPLGGQHS